MNIKQQTTSSATDTTNSSSLINRFIENDLKQFSKLLIDFNHRVKSTVSDVAIESVNMSDPNLIELNEMCLTFLGSLEALSIKIDDRQSKHLADLVRNILADLFCQSNILSKAINKSHGYPGDYEMMNYVYNMKTDSKTILGKYLDALCLIQSYARAVRGRKNKMVDILSNKIKNCKTKSLRILNLPCGPNRDVKELCELVNIRKDIDIEIVCVDNEMEALIYANESIKNIPSNVKIKYIKGNIIDYVRHPKKYQNELGKFDIIYSIGLADYLQDKFLKKMIDFSTSLWKPNGEIIYAFKIKESNPSGTLFPKWFCDWTFVPRNLDDATSLYTDYRHISTEWEESNTIVFLTYQQ